MLRFGLLVLPVAALAACSSDSAAAGPVAADAGAVDAAPIADGGPGPGPEPTLSGVCATEHPGSNADGDAVVFCDSMFDAAPRVRLPADSLGAAGAPSTIYVALGAKLTAASREGKVYELLDEAGAPFKLNLVSSTPPPAGPPALRMPSHRYLFTLYRVTGVITEAGLRVTTAAPVVVLDGKAIDSAFLGAWEGTITKRMPGGTFDGTTRVPVRLSFTTLEPAGSFNVWGYAGATLPDGAYYKAAGTIENATAGVRAADGSCIASLDALGDGDPFGNATSTSATVKIRRVPSMHAPGDDVIVIDYPATSPGGFDGMATTFVPVSTRTAIAAVAPTQAPLSFFVHGTPNGFNLEIHPAKGGGGACP